MLKWRDTGDVLVLTTKHTDGVVDIDLSDQLKAYSHYLRRGTPWYRKLAVELIFEICLVNSYILYKEITKEKMQITEFRENLALALLGLKKGNDHPTEHQYENQHKLEEATRGRCVKCYSKIKKTLGRHIP
ncbi:uncharacterized protein [Diabrotica undecimpunctata]|uniref:uncharacterized protein n=1 Tax=Diabrotica undecimpunctata TaxID=50387 RepID=UPI003B6322BF